MIYVFLAPGFEEIEALATVDILRRAGLQVCTVGVGEDLVVGSHQIPVSADIYEKNLKLDENTEGIFLPGGMPGTLNLEKSETVNKAIDYCVENNLLISAICAAPSILGHKGILNGKNAVCFPGFEDELKGAVLSDKFICEDGNIMTAKGMGSAVEFGTRIAARLVGNDKAKSVHDSLQIYHD